MVVVEPLCACRDVVAPAEALELLSVPARYTGLLLRNPKFPESGYIVNNQLSLLK